MKKKIKFSKKNLYSKTPSKLIRIGHALQATSICMFGYSFLTEFKKLMCITIIIFMVSSFIINYAGEDDGNKEKNSNNRR
jgi:hypothetical protein